MSCCDLAMVSRMKSTNPSQCRCSSSWPHRSDAAALYPSRWRWVSVVWRRLDRFWIWGSENFSTVGWSMTTDRHSYHVSYHTTITFQKQSRGLDEFQDFKLCISNPQRPLITSSLISGYYPNNVRPLPRCSNSALTISVGSIGNLWNTNNNFAVVLNLWILNQSNCFEHSHAHDCCTSRSSSRENERPERHRV